MTIQILDLPHGKLEDNAFIILYLQNMFLRYFNGHHLPSSSVTTLHLLLPQLQLTDLEDSSGGLDSPLYKPELCRSLFAEP